MSLSKHDIPHHMEAVHIAFHKVCDVLFLNGDVGDSVTDFIVNKIVNLVKAGEHDPDRFTWIVLDHLMDEGALSSQPHTSPEVQNRGSALS